MLEARRLAAVGLKFYRKAMAEAVPQAAIVFIKASERRAMLQGANHPVGHAVTVMHEAAPQKLISTEKIRAALTQGRLFATRPQRANPINPADLIDREAATH